MKPIQLIIISALLFVLVGYANGQQLNQIDENEINNKITELSQCKIRIDEFINFMEENGIKSDEQVKIYFKNKSGEQIFLYTLSLKKYIKDRYPYLSTLKIKYIGEYRFLEIISKTFSISNNSDIYKYSYDK